MNETAMTQEDRKLEFSGERFIPDSADVGAETRAEHLLRYHASLPFVAGRTVLDVASGEGYGSAMLAEKSRSVDGLDVSPEVVRFSAHKYASIKNLSFKCGSATNLPYVDQTFDVVVSFETIEHLEQKDQRSFLEEVFRVLKKDGIFIVSTPNRENYNLLYPKKNEFHLHELSKEEFLSSLHRFVIHKIYNQSVMSFVSIWSESDATYSYHGDMKPSRLDEIYHVVICGRENSRAPSASMASLTYDSQLSSSQMRITLQSKEDHIQTISAWAKARDAKATELETAVAASRGGILQVFRNDSALKTLQEKCDRAEAALAVAKDRIKRLESRLNEQ